MSIHVPNCHVELMLTVSQRNTLLGVAVLLVLPKVLMESVYLVRRNIILIKLIILISFVWDCAHWMDT